MTTLIFRIGEIHCIGCVNRIKSALNQYDVENVDIDLMTHIAKVVVDQIDPDINTYLNAITQTGYHAEFLTSIKEDV